MNTGVPSHTDIELPDSASWTPLSISVVSLCFLLNMLDGADMLIISFIAPVLADQWSISPESLGMIFSASLAGMATGCLIIAPQGDRIGRKPLIIGALLVLAVAMIGSGFCSSVTQLVIARFLVGCAVGTVGVTMTTMASEFAPPSHSSFAAGVVQAGWPVGAIITAFVAASLIESLGWDTLLISLGWVSIGLAVMMLFWLPESMQFLLRSGKNNSLERANALRVRLGLTVLDALPASAGEKHASVPELFQDGRKSVSILLWTAVSLGYFVLYFAISWIPKLAVDAGLALDQAIYAGATYNLGAAIGTALVAWLSIRLHLPRVVATFFLLAAVALLVYGNLRFPVVVTLAMAGCVGLFVQGAFNGFWPMAASLYPSRIRSTGVGWALGVGRIGAVLGPIVGGVLIGAGVSTEMIFSFYALPAVLAALTVISIRR